MPGQKLIDLFVGRVKPPQRGRLESFDAGNPGPALRVTEKGGKHWSVLHCFGGRLRRHTIGAHPALKPAKARRPAGSVRP
jgi:hypothetical protein